MVNVGDTAALIQYVNNTAPQYGIDPSAALAIAKQEGWGGTVGDNGLAYGPWQDHLTEFVGRPMFGQGANNQAVQAWAWSNAGIDYVLQQMATTGKAKGLSGLQAVQNIARNFEAPAEPPTGIGWWQEAQNAWNNAYRSFANGSDVGTDGSVSSDDPVLQAGAALVSGQSTASSSSSSSANFSPILGSAGLGTLVGRLTSPGFWWAAGFLLVAGVMILLGLLVYFREPIERGIAVMTKDAAAVAA